MKRKIQRATSMGCHVAVVLAIGGCQIQPAGAPCDDGLCPEGKICVTPSELLGTQKRCVVPGICNNGFWEADLGEECDDGEKNNDHGHSHCNTECRLNPCGNGHMDRGEECDEGINNGDDKDCRSDCIINRCGDGRVDTNGLYHEECDGGLKTDDGSPTAIPRETDDCNVNCTKRICGDGIVNHAADEECDDGRDNNGNNNNGDDKDCRSDCIVNRCGDGYADTNGLHYHEECDDVPQVEHGRRDVHPDMTSTCNRDCTTPSCGDGIVNTSYRPKRGSDLTEQCDDGGTQSGDGCSEFCQSEWCGNGVVDPDLGEECDGDQGPERCVNCRLVVCGNGRVDPGEVCDDHNTDACGSCSERCDQITSRHAFGFIFVVPGSSLNDGATFTLNDGINPPVVFEFDEVNHPGVSGDNVAVSFNFMDGTVAPVRQAIEGAIQGQHDHDKLLIAPLPHDPNHPDDAFVVLLHDRPTSRGNQAIMQDTPPGLATMGMAGGQGGDCLATVSCSSNDDCVSHDCHANQCSESLASPAIRR